MEIEFVFVYNHEISVDLLYCNYRYWDVVWSGQGGGQDK